jgi:hypothetical protein
VPAVSVRVDGCGLQKNEVTRLALMSMPFTHEFHFGPGCDLEGVVRFEERPTPVDLKVRNVGPVRRVRGFLMSTAGGPARFGFILRLSDGKLELAGHREPCEVSAELDVGYRGIFKLGREAHVDGQLSVWTFDGQPAPLTARLEFSRSRD